MRVSSLLWIILVSATPLTWPSEAAAQCPSTSARLYFLPGIKATTPESSAMALQDVINADLKNSDGSQCDAVVDTLPNRTFGLIADLCESALQLNLIDSTSNCLDAINALLPNDPKTAAIIKTAIDQFNGPPPSVKTVLTHYKEDFAKQLAAQSRLAPGSDR